MEYDVIIIGMGPAGMSAAIYAQRSKLNTLIIEKNIPGGLINYTNVVNNYPGFSSISGPDLAIKMFEQIKKLNIPFKTEEVIKIISGKIKKVITKNNEYKTKSIIIATGRGSRKLGLPNEEELIGRGISYCALCDAPLYKGKQIAVVGGGNSSLEEGLYLSKYAKKITIINRSNNLIADDFLEDKIKESKNIEVLMNKEIKSINEKKGYLSSLTLNDDSILEVEGLFIYIGFEPKTEIVKELNITNELNYIKVDNNYETDIDGIFAVGDTIEKDIYQIVTAVAEGATAATNIYKKYF